MGDSSLPPRAPNDNGAVLDELRAIRAEQAATRHLMRAIYELLDDGARTFLNARFPFGKPVDRFGRRPRG